MEILAIGGLIIAVIAYIILPAVILVKKDL